MNFETFRYKKRKEKTQIQRTYSDGEDVFIIISFLV